MMINQVISGHAIVKQMNVKIYLLYDCVYVCLSAINIIYR